MGSNNRVPFYIAFPVDQTYYLHTQIPLTGYKGLI